MSADRERALDKLRRLATVAAASADNEEYSIGQLTIRDANEILRECEELERDLMLPTLLALRAECSSWKAEAHRCAQNANRHRIQRDRAEQECEELRGELASARIARGQACDMTDDGMRDLRAERDSWKILAERANAERDRLREEIKLLRAAEGMSDRECDAAHAEIAREEESNHVGVRKAAEDHGLDHGLDG